MTNDKGAEPRRNELQQAAHELRIRAMSCRMIANRIIDRGAAAELRELASQLEAQADGLASAGSE